MFKHELVVAKQVWLANSQVDDIDNSSGIPLSKMQYLSGQAFSLKKSDPVCVGYYLTNLKWRDLELINAFVLKLFLQSINQFNQFNQSNGKAYIC